MLNKNKNKAFGPLGKNGTTAISKETNPVRGAANKGPIAKYVTQVNNKAKIGCTLMAISSG